MSAPLNPEELAAMEARCEAATPGPWNDRDELELRDPNGYAVVWFYPPNTDLWEHQGTELHDANFIAHARTDMPRLIAEVKRLREEANTRDLQARIWYKADGREVLLESPQEVLELRQEAAKELGRLRSVTTRQCLTLLHAEQALERGDTQEAQRLLGSAQAGELLTSEELEQIEAAERCLQPEPNLPTLTEAGLRCSLRETRDHTHRLLAIVGKFRKGVE